VLSLPPSVRIFIARDAVDCRKSHDGLHALVRDHFGDDPMSGHLFVFFNRQRDRVKVLVWDRNGYWLFYKRLERGTFRVLTSAAEKRVEAKRAELMLLLEGIDLEKGKYRPHFADGIRIGKRACEDAERGRTSG
jgi:transposase